MFPQTSGVRFTIALLAAWGAVQPTLVVGAYPDKPVRIVATAPGAGQDVTARIIAPRLSERWGQPVIVENRGGAGGTIAAALAAKAAPDGYTLLMADMTQLVSAQKVYRSIPYHPQNDFLPVTLILTVPLVLTVHPTQPAANLRELIAYAKQQPGRLTYSSGSVGTPGHLTSALLGLLAGIDMVHVPYKGGAAALVALIGREVQLTATTILVAAPHIKGGRLKALAVAAKNRVAALPEIATGAEAGVPGLESANWFGVVVPARTREPVIERLNRDVIEIVREPATQALLAAQGGEIATGTPGDFREWIHSETVKWGKVIQATGVKAD